MKRRGLSAMFCLLVAVGLWSQEAGFPENYEARQALSQVLLAPDPKLALKEPARVLNQDLSPMRVRFQTARQKSPGTDGKLAEAVYLLFLNENLKDGSFPMGGAGTFILKRDLTTGDFVQVKIFLQDLEGGLEPGRDDQGTFLRLRPSLEQPRTQTRLELFLMGQRLDTDVNLPFSLQQVLLLPVQSLMRSALGPTDWDLVFPHWEPAAAGVVDLVAQIREQLPKASFVPEGVMDERLQYRNLVTGGGLEKPGLGSLGFAKWLADGLYAAKFPGRGLSIAPLMEPAGNRGANPSVRQWEDAVQPFQALDWVRNLGFAVQKALYPTRGATVLSQDIKGMAGITAFPDRGFALPKLKLILYLLAIQKPGRFYLGSVSAEEKTVAGAPLLITHRRALALFPWIDEAGRFQLAVFEASRETSLETIAGLYRANLLPFVHLVELPVPAGIKLPALDFPPL